MLYIKKIKHLLDLNYIYANVCVVFVSPYGYFFFFSQQKRKCLLIMNGK